MIAAITSVVAVCVTVLIAWRWRIDFQRWQLERADKQRDEALETLEPRVRALEKLVKDAQYGKAFVR